MKTLKIIQELHDLGITGYHEVVCIIQVMKALSSRNV